MFTLADVDRYFVSREKRSVCTMYCQGYVLIVSQILIMY